MIKKTFLNAIHREFGGKMVEFGGWDMPVHYGSQVKEHELVRSDAGMFDVSHMTVLDLKGVDVKPFLKKLLANNVDKLKAPGKGLYSCMLTPEAGVIDDLITYVMAEDWSRMVVNASTREKDVAWIRKIAADFDMTVEEPEGLCMVAVQGPNATDKLVSVVGEACKTPISELKMFTAYSNGEWFVARTGYTGENGFEVILPEADVSAFWVALAEAGVQPCGLGARDTLRLEAGLNLYGNDMDETISPLACGLEWTVAWAPEERDFIGREALTALKGTENRRFVGLILEGKGVLREHQKVMINGEEVGELTSGTFSPTMQKAISLARISDLEAAECDVQIRNKSLKAKIVAAPFVRNGEARY